MKKTMLHMVLKATDNTPPNYILEVIRVSEGADMGEAPDVSLLTFDTINKVTKAMGEVATDFMLTGLAQQNGQKGGGGVQVN